MITNKDPIAKLVFMAVEFVFLVFISVAAFGVLWGAINWRVSFFVFILWIIGIRIGRLTKTDAEN